MDKAEQRRQSEKVREDFSEISKFAFKGEKKFDGKT